MHKDRLPVIEQGPAHSSDYSSARSHQVSTESHHSVAGLHAQSLRQPKQLSQIFKSLLWCWYPPTPIPSPLRHFRTAGLVFPLWTPDPFLLLTPPSFPPRTVSGPLPQVLSATKCQELLKLESQGLRRLVPRTKAGVMGVGWGVVKEGEEEKDPPSRPHLIATFCIITHLTQHAFK